MRCLKLLCKAFRATVMKDSPATDEEQTPGFQNNNVDIQDVRELCHKSTDLAEADRSHLLDLISGDLTSSIANTHLALKALELFLRTESRPFESLLFKLLQYLTKSRAKVAEESSIKIIQALSILVSANWSSTKGWNEGKARLKSLDIAPGINQQLLGSSFVVPSSKASLATSLIIHYFYEGLNENPRTAVHGFEALLQIAGPDCEFQLCRIAALKILCNLRCTSAGIVYLEYILINENTAAALCRTHATFQEVSNETSRGTSKDSYQPAWMFEDPKIPFVPVSVIEVAKDTNNANETGTQPAAPGSDEPTLDFGRWLATVTHCLEIADDWEIQSFILVYLGDQLRNTRLFSSSETVQHANQLRRILCKQVTQNEIHEPPTTSGLKQSDVALCIFDILTALIPYASAESALTWNDRKEFGLDLVKTFLNGIANIQYDGTARDCIHGLATCSSELPDLVAAQGGQILAALAKYVSQAHLTVHILELLSQLASIKEFRSSSPYDEIRPMLGVCILLLQQSREHDAQNSEQARESSLLHAGQGLERASTPSREERLGEHRIKRPPYRAAIVKDDGLHRYASALAYHTIIVWFLGVPLEQRSDIVKFVMRRLIYRNEAQEDAITEQSEALIDMMLNYIENDPEEVLPVSQLGQVDSGDLIEKSWLVAYGIVTVQADRKTSLTQVTHRLPSTTKYKTITPPKASATNSDPGSAVQPTQGMRVEIDEPVLFDRVFRDFCVADRGRPVLRQPIALLQTKAVQNALDIFDRVAIIDSYKVGVLFIGPGQSKESEFYLNGSGTSDYHRLLDGLGDQVLLRELEHSGRFFQTHGLRDGKDGTATIAWRDPITEVVFLCATLMPLDDDEEEGNEWIRKKGHLGNSFATIIFNRSGKRWNFDNLQTQFNFVNIVIEPADREQSDIDGVSAPGGLPFPAVPASEQTATLYDEPMPKFYKVVVLTKADHPNISAAANPKIISAANLASFVRKLAINAVVFSKVQESIRQGDKEFPSDWRERLRQIKVLKERYGPKQEDTNDNFLKELDFEPWRTEPEKPSQKRRMKGFQVLNS